MDQIYKKDIKDLTKKFAVRIVKYVAYLKSQKTDFVLRDQLLRSGTSIGANVREAKASSSRKEFIRFNEIALRSINETEYWIELLAEAFDFNESPKELEDDLLEIKRILTSIIVKLKSTL